MYRALMASTKSMQTQNCDNCIPYDTDIKTVIICKIQLYKSPSYHQMVVVVCRYFSHPATNSLLRLLPNHKIGIGVQMMVCILDFLSDICHKSVNFLLRPAEVAAEECVGVGSNSLEHIHLVIKSLRTLIFYLYLRRSLRARDAPF